MNIIENEADYILGVKGNQGNLEQAILDTVSLEKPVSINIMEDSGHGRIEVRTCKANSNLRHIEKSYEWIGLSTLFIVESKIFLKSTGK